MELSSHRARCGTASGGDEELRHILTVAKVPPLSGSNSWQSAVSGVASERTQPVLRSFIWLKMLVVDGGVWS